MIDKALLKGINEEFLLSNEVIPAFKENDVLTLIMSNPLDKDMIQSLGRVFKVRKIKPVRPLSGKTLLSGFFTEKALLSRLIGWGSHPRTKPVCCRFWISRRA